MGFRLGKATIRHIMLLLSKGGLLMRGKVGGIRAGLSGVWRLEVLVQS